MVPSGNNLKILVKILSKMSIVHYVQGFCSSFPLPTAYVYLSSLLLIGARIVMLFLTISLRMFYLKKRFAVQTFFGNERIDRTPIHQKINHTNLKKSVKIALLKDVSNYSAMSSATIQEKIFESIRRI